MDELSKVWLWLIIIWVVLGGSVMGLLVYVWDLHNRIKILENKLGVKFIDNKDTEVK